MRICVYADIHGNLEALKSLLETDDYKKADLRIFLGDAVCRCAFPNECLETILNSEDMFLMGNSDSYVTYGLPEEERIHPNASIEHIAHQDLMFDIVNEKYKKKLLNLPKDFRLKILNKNIYFSHYVWENEFNVIDSPKTTPKNIYAIWNNVHDADIIVYGHDHKPAMLQYKNRKFICVGSTGMKYPGNYLIIDEVNNELFFENKELFYDIDKTKNDMIKSNFPNVDKHVKYF